ncbi:hypothetical protein CN984_12225 [Bacillus cereus]|uniref:Uncharacterized protein n=1 Tax=Bacillus cereus TaxID=1396 RepID=A0A2A7FNH6_BACCE|nr:hypothetical protein [Bacillus cereus]PEA25816.1 hypothetical protein CON44_17870 [Bacillus cereus]PGO29203.1 hypothetical protein CN984_12225 [Bacillus cereus]
MAYKTEIRILNPDRKNYTTTLSTELLEKVKLIAVEQDTSYNFLLEDGIQYVLDNFTNKGDYKKRQKPNRVKVNTTYSEALFKQLKTRAILLGAKNNDLIEIGMEYIIERNTK